jgi:hypothetical protein
MDLLSTIFDELWVVVESFDELHWEKTSSSLISIPSRDTVRVRSIVISVLIIEGEETVRTSEFDVVTDF